MGQIMKMKLKNRRVLAGKNRFIRTPLQAALLLCFPVACVTKAQQVLMPRPEYSIVPPALQQFQTNEMDVFAPPGVAAAAPSEATPFQLGPVSLLPHVFYRFLSGDGIPAAGSNHVSTIIQEISPGILFNIGSHWSLDYTPTWRLFSNKQFRDTLDQNVILTGGTTYEDWILGLTQSYISSSTPLVETGTQTDQQSWLTALKASYRFNSKMTMDLMLDQNIVSADTFTSYREWSTLDWLNYEFWPRLDASLGVSFGFVNVDAGSDMTYEQLQARVRWRATDKISFQVHGGLEDRQFLQGSAGSLLNPVAGALIQYQPFEVTKFSITVDRTVAVSYFQNQVTEGTEVMGDLNQRLLKRLYLDLSGGYHTVKYVGAGASGTGRRDDYYTFDARLSCPFLKRGTAAVFYQYSNDSSTTPGFTFSSSQVGFELGYRF
jgi:hypothetical protein